MPSPLLDPGATTMNGATGKLPWPLGADISEWGKTILKEGGCGASQHSGMDAECWGFYFGQAGQGSPLGGGDIWATA